MDVKSLAKNFKNILLNNRKELPKFLETYGKYETLVELIKCIEEDGTSWCGLLLFGNNRDYNGIYELPTNELCEVLASIIYKFDIKSIHEVGAGNGLLSARLLPYLKEIGTKLYISDSKKWSINNGSTYVPVETKSFEQFDKKDKVENILISWLHQSAETDFIDMIKKVKPKNIFHIGEGKRGRCYGDDFIKELCNLGYEFTYIPAKQISNIDYFLKDKIRAEVKNGTRTVITWFSLNDLPDKRTIVDICGADNLGTYLKLDFKYTMQDLEQI